MVLVLAVMPLAWVAAGFIFSRDCRPPMQARITIILKHENLVSTIYIP